MPTRVIAHRIVLAGWQGRDALPDPLPDPLSGIRCECQDGAVTLRQIEEGFAPLRERRSAVLAGRVLRAAEPGCRVSVLIEGDLEIQLTGAPSADLFWAAVRAHYPDGEYRSDDNGSLPATARFAFGWRGWSVRLRLERRKADRLCARGRLERAAGSPAAAATAIEELEPVWEGWLDGLRRYGFEP